MPDSARTSERSEDAVVPILAWRGRVLPEWIDVNDHMTSMAYPALFHPNSGPLFARIGIDLSYMTTRGLSVFQREFRLAYDRELRLGDPIEIRSWLVAHDEKRLHHFHELYHSTKGYRAACVEYMSLHIDMTTRRVSPFPVDVMERLEMLAATFADVERPAGIGMPIGIPPRRD
jgi:acyl-CoA thioester hydrolase